MEQLDLLEGLARMRAECEDLYVAARANGLKETGDLLSEVLRDLASAIPECRAEYAAKKADWPVTGSLPGE